jgi:hypothetical protein
MILYKIISLYNQRIDKNVGEILYIKGKRCTLMSDVSVK